jgi:hypothetical protein
LASIGPRHQPVFLNGHPVAVTADVRIQG